MGIKAILSKPFKKKQKTLLVLLYHKVNDSQSQDGLSVQPSVYKSHLKFLNKKWQIFKSVEDWEQSSDSGIMITFDDGYANNLHVVLPIHEELQVPFTLFTTTHWLDGSHFWWDVLSENKDSLEKSSEISLEEISKEIMHQSSYLEKQKKVNSLVETYNLNVNLGDNLRCMNLSELKELSDSKWVTIGSHTMTHPRLALLTDENQTSEIEKSKSFLEQNLNQDISTFSYPHGGKTAFNSFSKTAVKNAGYKYAFAAYSGVIYQDFNPFEIPRVHIGNISVNALRKKIKGFL